VIRAQPQVLDRCRVEAHDPRGGGIDPDQVARRQDDVHLFGAARFRPVALQADRAIHDGEAGLDQRVHINQRARQHGMEIVAQRL